MNWVCTFLSISPESIGVVPQPYQDYMFSLASWGPWDCNLFQADLLRDLKYLKLTIASHKPCGSCETGGSSHLGSSLISWWFVAETCFDPNFKYIRSDQNPADITWYNRVPIPDKGMSRLVIRKDLRSPGKMCCWSCSLVSGSGLVWSRVRTTWRSQMIILNMWC